ncbi:MAG: hypothetical protein ACYC7A_05055 [Thermoanaerobaculia bacterium]
MMRTTVAVVMLLLSPAVLPAAEQPPADQFETWLIPVSEHARPGAYGALWATTAWIAIDGNPNDPADIVKLGPFGVCQNICSTVEEIPAGPPFSPILSTSAITDPPGKLFYVERAKASRVWMKIRVQDLARTTPMRVGVELPVLREDEFLRGGHILLLNIPGDPQFRQWLRAYDIDANPQSDFRVIVRRQSSSPRTGDFVAETTIRTAVPSTPASPGAASLDLRALIPQESGATFYVEITPLDPSIRYWAFATVTSNETQEIVTVTP